MTPLSPQHGQIRSSKAIYLQQRLSAERVDEPLSLPCRRDMLLLNSVSNRTLFLQCSSLRLWRFSKSEQEQSQLRCLR